jgi:hypothetical protein
MEMEILGWISLKAEASPARFLSSAAISKASIDDIIFHCPGTLCQYADAETVGICANAV